MPADPPSPAPGADRWLPRRLEPFRHPIAGIPVGWLIVFFLFADAMLAFPRIDPAVAGLFYTAGVGFGAQGTIWEQVVYRSVAVLMVAGNLALIAVWAANRWRGRRFLDLTGRKLLLLLCVLALFPGLLVNQGLKEHWGRARPVQTSTFGGERPFTPAFVPAKGNGGSFSSGHVAAAAYLIAVAHLLAGPRSWWVVLAALYTALVGVARMAAGGHFISDVLTSVFVVLFGYLVLRHTFFPDLNDACRQGAP
ncbi:MAG: phosphatase PAP2 family protein [Thiohalocapsa sp.]|jgi:lipid A 4'-phosphatase|uniref:phosphatase PAP2 family protein n=1 Tax=Thiohalocapsa sp. TaxID=2497641 RepID=UPI0025D1CA2A|nr:phosphatase PAP2 family protein [Thiohalocapsa sp.]MCG6942422.1 phosphatase PAP2 family protein [Thiohalocapsa sp.]